MVCGKEVKVREMSALEWTWDDVLDVPDCGDEVERWKGFDRLFCFGGLRCGGRLQIWHGYRWSGLDVHRIDLSRG